MQIAIRQCIKDLKHRWPYILILELLILLRAVLDILLPLYPQLIRWHNYFPSFLVILSFCIISVLTLQADPLAGDRQFWVTRPISGRNLLAGKMLFLICSIHIPILVAQSATMIAYHLSPLRHILLLCQNQLVIGAGVALIAVLASATRTLARFALMVIVLFYSSQAADFIFYLPLTMTGAVNVEPWGSAECIKSLILSPPILLIALLLLWFQYSKRTINKALTICLLSISFSLNSLIFGSTVLWHPIAQCRAWMTGVLSDKPPVSVEILHENFRFYKSPSDSVLPYRIDIPLRIQGIPENHKLIFEKINCAGITPDGSKWESGWVGKDIGFTPALTQNGGIPADGDYSISMKSEWMPLGRFQNAILHVHAMLTFRLIAPPITTPLTQGEMVPVIDKNMRCGVISKNGNVQPICIATELQKAFLDYQPSLFETGANISIWRLTVRDSSILGLSSQPSGATISVRPEEAWFTTTLDVPKIRLKE